MKEPITAGEIAANILGTKNIKTLVCAWIDEEGQAVWYKMGGALEGIGMLHVLMTIFEDEFIGGEEEE